MQTNERLTQKEIKAIAVEAFLVQGNVDDAMILVEDYPFADPEDAELIREFMEDHEDQLLALYEKYN